VITFKKPQEFARMAVAGRVVAAAHAAVRESIRPGVSMEQLDLIADRAIRDGNCIPSFLGYRGYPAAICASPNDVIVHGIPGDYRLREGDLISIDVGAIYEGFHGDAAFSAIVGSATAEVVKLNAVTEEAMWAGVAAVRHGARVGDVAHAVEVVGRREGYGIVEGYGGHGIGRQMHEEPHIPNVGHPGRGYKLKTGMAICIEPMFNLGSAGTRVDPDGWTVRTIDGSISAHWEHTVAITPDGVVVTTTAEEVAIAVG
jgi:methionyl aminopeptidase